MRSVTLLKEALVERDPHTGHPHPGDPHSRAQDPRQLFDSKDPGPVPCHLVRALMPALSGGDVDPKTADVIERHTRECLSCRRESMQFESARDALASLAPDSPHAPQFDDDFFASLRSGIVGEIRRDTQRIADFEALESSPALRRRPGRLREWLPAAAALIVTLVGGLLIGRSMSDGAQDRPPAGVDASVVGVSPAARRALDLRDPVIRDLALKLTHILDSAVIVEPAPHEIVPVSNEVDAGAQSRDF